MAAAPRREKDTVILAIIIEEDGTVSDFAVMHQVNRDVKTGKGAADLEAFAEEALREEWLVKSLGGLDAMRRAADELETCHALKQLAGQHCDAAYDFLVDNGYPLLWESAFPDTPVPDTAESAAKIIAKWLEGAETSGVVKRLTVAGKASFWPLVAYDGGTPRFRAVAEAFKTFKLCPPNQSWMTSNVPDIASETAWLSV